MSGAKTKQSKERVLHTTAHPLDVVLMDPYGNISRGGGGQGCLQECGDGWNRQRCERDVPVSECGREREREKSAEEEEQTTPTAVKAISLQHSL